MLFSSQEFLFVFLPLSLAATFIATRLAGRNAGFLVLVAASIIFYGWQNPGYVLLLGASIAVNFAVGVTLEKYPRRRLLTLGVVFNLALIGYYKYAYFLTDIFNNASGMEMHLGSIVLPLAISFFTFQQIAYLVDVYRGKVKDTSFLHYCLFVTFFPQLIAGPIVHHAEVIPQFEKPGNFTFDWDRLRVGAAIFLLGLYKKIVFADGISVYANSVFSAAAETPPTFFEAWGGALAYSFQIYFDFSGYSDMAIGLAWIFGIALPINFFSPYKAVNIIEFWRRWHMTLSRFLRDYLYYPLGGNRKGLPRRYANLMTVMLLGGLWHGAGWTFAVWGGLHGFYLIINHAWHALQRIAGGDPARSRTWARSAATALTFLSVVVAWVFFRAESWQGAFNILEGMMGLNGAVLPVWALDSLGPVGSFLVSGGVTVGKTPLMDVSGFVWIAGLLAIVWLMPNTQQLFESHAPGLDYDACRVNFGGLHSNKSVVLMAKISGLFGWASPMWKIPIITTSVALMIFIVIMRGAEMSPFIYMFF